MAKTKHDYFREGVSDFTANNPRRVYTAGSWQERHYNDGWSHACAREAAETEAQCIDAPYENIGDSRVNADGSVSTLVDNGDGTIGTYTTGCPKPERPILHDPFAEVPIPGPAAKRGPRWKYDPALTGTANAVAAHIKYLRDQAANDGGKRAHRLNQKAAKLLEKWKPVMMADLVG